MPFEWIQDYAKKYPAAQVGPWEDTTELLEEVSALRQLGLQISVLAESPEFADTIRVFSGERHFTAEQVCALLRVFRGFDEVGSFGDFIELWWD